MPLGDIDLGSFEVLSDHGDEVHESTKETTEMMPPLPWFKYRRFAGSFGNLAMKITKTKGIRFFDCWDGKQEQSDALQQSFGTKRTEV